jgi:hypothetical protein
MAKVCDFRSLRKGTAEGSERILGSHSSRHNEGNSEAQCCAAKCESQGISTEEIYPSTRSPTLGCSQYPGIKSIRLILYIASFAYPVALFPRLSRTLSRTDYGVGIV